MAAPGRPLGAGSPSDEARGCAVRCAMPRDGSLTLSDVRSPALEVVCDPCGRRGRYSVAKLMAEHGDAKLTDLLLTLAACPKARSASIHDRCKAVYGQRLP